MATPTVRLASVRSLRDMALDGEDNRYWYRDAERQVQQYAASVGVAPEVVAYVLAATSPRVHVIRNIRLTREYCEAYAAWGYGALDYSGMARSLLPATRTALLRLELAFSNGEPVPWATLGKKTGPFGRAIADGGGEHLVIDVWMSRALVRGHTKLGKVWPKGPPTAADNDRAYGWLFSQANNARVRERLGKVARQLGWPVAEVQAAIWATAMRQSGRQSGISFPAIRPPAQGEYNFFAFEG